MIIVTYHLWRPRIGIMPDTIVSPLQPVIHLNVVNDRY